MVSRNFRGGVALPDAHFFPGIQVKSGEKIAFLGDSITAGGMGSATGYCRLVISGLEANAVNAVAIGAGISGHKSNQMLERLDKDVISKNRNG